jgi:regulator of protease activity HflC (stomatin/prohibitin superfamily)
MNEQKVDISKIIISGGVVVILFLILLGGLYTVPTGHRGVLTTFGNPEMDAKPEGLGFKIPIAQKVTDLEVRTQKLEVNADGSTFDLQDVQVVIALNYNVIPESVPKLYTEIGLDYRSRLVDPAVQESVKAVTATYKAEELITKRPQVRSDIKTELKERLGKSYILVTDFNIVNFQFSAEFDSAIESKVTAEQLKLKAERDLERIKIEKEQLITQAEAEAQALRLQKQEITPELIQLRQIEMMKKAIEKWNGVMPEATSGMPFIDVSPSSLN